MFDLAGIKVLVDGYHLQISKGAGITTYTINLLESLTALKADIGLLFGVPTKRYTNSYQQAIQFLSKLSVVDPNYLGRIELVKYYINKFSELAYLFSFGNIQSINYSNKLSPPEYFQEAWRASFSLFNSPYCFEKSKRLFQLFSINHHLKMSEEFHIFHATYPWSIKIRNAKKITTIHDVIPLIYSWTTAMNKEFFYNSIKDAISNSTALITVSETSKQDILAFFDCDPQKIFVTYQPLDHDFIQLDTNFVIDRLKRYNLSYQQYILFVSTIQLRKNLPRLIDAYLQLDLDYDLVVVGQKGWLYGAVSQKMQKLTPAFRQKIKLLDYVPKADLPFLYSGANCLVFPSLYEGFGLPALEAMSYGCPVVASNNSSLPEVCGSAGIYVDPLSVDSIADGITKVLGDADLRAKLIIEGAARCAVFSRDNYQKKLLTAYCFALDH